MVTVSDAGPVDREIPWRQGTRVRSAKRAEVLSLLVSATAPPTVQFITASLVVTHVLAGSSDPVNGRRLTEDRLALRLWSQLFIDPTIVGAGPIMLPTHLWSLELAIAMDRRVLMDAQLLQGGRFGVAEEPNPHGDVVRAAGLYVSGPDVVRLEATSLLPMSEKQAIAFLPHLDIELRLPAVGSNREATATSRLAWKAGKEPMEEFDRSQVLGTWALESHSVTQ